MPLFHVHEKQMSFLQTIIGHLETIPSLDAKAEDITIHYSKDDLERIASSMRHFDNSDWYEAIEEGIRDTLL